MYTRHFTFSEAKKEKVNVLTHCNTGSLATGGYGTALGVIRALKELGHLSLAYCTETRPYNQGSRLTAYELVYEEIPAKLICDSAVSALMSTEVSTILHSAVQGVVYRGPIICCTECS